MSCYKALKTQIFEKGRYSIVPIRMEDRHSIRHWRNEQIFHLRQMLPLSQEEQDKYFDVIIRSLFEQDEPDQILFSYLEEGKCIGYGGLVHINRVDKNAEISFIMETSLEKYYFEKHWSNFLGLIEEVAFSHLFLHKIYVYAFDLRPHLYDVLKQNNYFLDALLKEHCLYNDSFLDVVIHSKLNDS